MINWVLGGMIAAFTIYIIWSTFLKIKKGKDLCGCDGCDSQKCESRVKK